MTFVRKERLTCQKNVCEEGCFEYETVINAFFSKTKSSAAIKIVLIREEYTQKWLVFSSRIVQSTSSSFVVIFTKCTAYVLNGFLFIHGRFILILMAFDRALYRPSCLEEWINKKQENVLFWSPYTDHHEDIWKCSLLQCWSERMQACVSRSLAKIIFFCL